MYLSQFRVGYSSDYVREGKKAASKYKAIDFHPFRVWAVGCTKRKSSWNFSVPVSLTKNTILRIPMGVFRWLVSQYKETGPPTRGPGSSICKYKLIKKRVFCLDALNVLYFNLKTTQPDHQLWFLFGYGTTVSNIKHNWLTILLRKRKIIQS